MTDVTETVCSLDEGVKPTFTIGGFFGSLGRSAQALPDLLGAYVPPSRLDPALREKVMVAVSRMNRCRHCTAIHTAWASLAGLSDDELARIEEMDPATFERRDWLAMKYARCLVAGADTREVEEELRQHYTDGEISRIAAVARGIDVANRSGNTWDSFESRLLGRGGETGSTLGDELAVLALLAPAGGPFLLVSKAVRALKGQPQL